MNLNSELLEKAERFQALHRESGTFVMPCAWDAFSAVLFERSGVACIGTTSGGVNWSSGRRDYVYTTPKEEMLSAYGDIASATRLPVSGDLENGYGEDPQDVVDTINKAIAAGMVGGSIEDQQVVPTDEHFGNGRLFDRDTAVARVRAARQAADAVMPGFTLTARCEIYYTDSADPFVEAVERLNAYREAGADCLFVPGLNTLPELELLVREVAGTVNFGMGATETPITVQMLTDIGIRRISTGGGLTRAAFGMVQQSVADIVEHGTFGYLETAISEAQINQILPGNS